ncbi:MAG: calcium-binding protein, partial [Planctomycetota bacterium]
TDTIAAGNGNNIVLGDNGKVDYQAGTNLLETISTTDPDIGGGDAIDSGSGDDVVLGGVGTDTIAAGNGNNIVLGDNGKVDYQAGTNLLETISTTDADIGGNDAIASGNGNDVILGVGADTIAAGDGNNIVLGDNGYIMYLTDGDPADIDLITATDPTIGGNDIITTGAGNDIIIAGTAADTASAGAGNDLVFGDHGKVEGDVDANLLPLAMSVKPFSFTAIYTQNSDGGGNDWLSGDAGEDIILGQQGGDVIWGGDDDDDLIGGHNVQGGHDGGDSIDGGAGNDVIAGDNAVILRSADTLNARMRELAGETIYDANGNPLITGDLQTDPYLTSEREITILDHSFTPASDTWGSDYIAGGAGRDIIFGELGNDVIQGDASITEQVSVTDPSFDGAGDGDDYIEGNGGDDLIFGNLGQDDLIGGSSNLYALASTDLRPDGSDVIYGGSGTDVARNTLGNLSDDGHALDADVILGDNGNIYRLLDATAGEFLTFNYDNYGVAKIIPRAFQMLDYTLGGSVDDIGAGDILHGEAGDDVIHGMTGNDVLFGEGQDDDLYGGTGYDRIYGGSGEDGVLGDDGKILTSRNGLSEPLNGLLAPNQQTNYALPGQFTGVVEYVTGRLHKTVVLAAWEIGGNDVIYGGLGDDFLHAGSGDDAVSGAEATAAFYNTVPPAETPLPYDPTTRKFDAYDAANPRLKITDFLLNFDAVDSFGAKIEDGKDRIFGDLGNDWLVGGTGFDRLFGGFGDDLLNADDNLDTNGGLNDAPDVVEFADGDFAFGGGGLDVLIANTGADRLFDWVGEFNSFIVPFGAFGAPTVNRLPAPHIVQFLLDLGTSSGCDLTRIEPDGELGLVTHKDPEWKEQCGGPRDDQAGNGNAKRDTQGAPEDESATLESDLGTPLKGPIPKKK